MLADSGVPWNNVLMPMPGTAQWTAVKADPGLAGPFGTTPSLEIRADGDGAAARRLPCNEALALAGFLGFRLPALARRPLDDVAWMHSTTRRKLFYCTVFEAARRWQHRQGRGDWGRCHGVFANSFAGFADGALCVPCAASRVLPVEWCVCVSRQAWPSRPNAILTPLWCWWSLCGRRLGTLARPCRCWYQR